jgi:hypothetical protein
VDTERAAREVAARVAALVVQTGATHIDAEETIRRMPAATGDVASGVAGASPVQPTGNVRAPRPLPDAAAGSATDLRPGEAACALCGTGNSAERRFCRRCGHPFGEETPAAVGPRTGWLARMGEWRRAHIPSVQLWPQGRALPSRRSVTGVGALVVAGLVVLGPWHLTRANIREHLFPRPRYIKPDQVSVVPKALYDGFDTPATVPGGSTIHFRLAAPVNLFKVGVEAKSTVPGVPTPDRLDVTIPGSRRSCTLVFAGNGGFHSTTCRANKVIVVDVRVAQPNSGLVQINEVEFFERS